MFEAKVSDGAEAPQCRILLTSRVEVAGKRYHERVVGRKLWRGDEERAAHSLEALGESSPYIRICRDAATDEKGSDAILFHRSKALCDKYVGDAFFEFSRDLHHEFFCQLAMCLDELAHFGFETRE